MYLTEIASSSLGNSFLSKVYEVHHKHKKDHPSGTALMLGKGIAVGKKKDFYKMIGNKYFNKTLSAVSFTIKARLAIRMGQEYFSISLKILCSKLLICFLISGNNKIRVIALAIRLDMKTYPTISLGL